MRGLLVLALAALPLVGVAEEERRNYDAPASQIAAAKKLLAKDLKDPDSLQVRNVVIRSIAGPEKGFLCGEFNAKNSYGGYVGFERFVFTDDTVWMDGVDSGNIMITAFCGDSW